MKKKHYSFDRVLLKGANGNNTLTSGDIWAFQEWLNTISELEEDGEDNRANRMKRNLKYALQDECSEKQHLYLSEYFFNGYKMWQIARRHEVAQSTVSRTIHRGLKRLEHCLKYSL